MPETRWGKYRNSIALHLFVFLKSVGKLIGKTWIKKLFSVLLPLFIMKLKWFTCSVWELTMKSSEEIDSRENRLIKKAKSLIVLVSKWCWLRWTNVSTAELKQNPFFIMISSVNGFSHTSWLCGCKKCRFSQDFPLICYTRIFCFHLRKITHDFLFSSENRIE